MNSQFPSIPWSGWKITGKLGEGSYSAVYQAERKENDGSHSYAAVKIITFPKTDSELEEKIRSLGSREAAFEYYKRQLDQCRNEFTLMKELRNNQNVVRVDDCQFTIQLSPFRCQVSILMELLTPLKDHLKSHRMTERDVIRLGIDLCNALEDCHSRHFYHRDIKPDNIFVSETGTYKLGDFGIASSCNNLCENRKTMGTLLYMAPEVYRNEPYTPKSDLYSLGLVLYQLLNHRRMPFVRRTKEPSRAELKKAAETRLAGKSIPFPANASWRTGRAILKACRFQPDRRYPDIRSFREELEGLLPDTSPAERRARIRRWVVACILAAAAFFCLWRFLPVPVQDGTTTLENMMLGKDPVPNPTPQITAVIPTAEPAPAATETPLVTEAAGHTDNVAAADTAAIPDSTKAENTGTETISGSASLNALSFTVEQTKGGNLVISWDNPGDVSYRMGWVSGASVSVYTDQGEIYKMDISHYSNYATFDSHSSGSIVFDTPTGRMNGRIVKIILSPVMKMQNTGGLPVLGSGKDVVISVQSGE